MIRIFIFTLLFLLTQQCAQKATNSSVLDQSIAPEPWVELPKELHESSGLEWVDHHIYSINDKGGKPELFVFDKNGKAQHKIKIKKADNYDWESLAANSTHIFIGDIGNNSGNRENLTIYKVPLSMLSADKVKAEKIQFKYANQTDYSKRKRNHKFDAEALIALNDKLVIFTKDWVDQSTQVFHLPLDISQNIHELEPQEEMSINALITGADYDEDKQRLILCGYKDYHNYLWIFENATPQNFLTDDYMQLELSSLYNAQVEGVSFINENQIIFSTEKTKKFKQQLWKIDLNEVIRN